MNIVVDKLQSERGGAEKVLKELCLILKPSVIYTTTVHNENEWKSYLQVEKIKTPIWGILFKNRKIWFIFYPLICLLYSLEKANKEELLFFYSSSAGKFLNIGQAKALLYTNFPARGIFAPETFFLNKISLFFIKPIVRVFGYFEKNQYKKFYNISCISLSAKDALLKYCKVNADIIYCPISEHWFDDDNKYTNKQIENSYVILSRLTAWKNLDYVFEYFESQHRRFLYVIGTGDLLEYFKKKYTKQCKFLGFVEEFALKQELLNHRALIFPNDQEWGLPLVEANACGLPVVALNSTAVNETQIIDEDNPQNGSCITFASKSSVDLNAALKKCESTDWDRSLILKNAKRFSPNNFKKNILNFSKDI